MLKINTKKTVILLSWGLIAFLLAGKTVCLKTNDCTHSSCKHTNRVNEADNFYVPVLYDTIIRGGTVIDPETKSLLKRDIGILDGKIAIIEEDLDPQQALEIFDLDPSSYVTPGLVDLHTHVYWGSTYWGIKPDPIAALTGVTTWVDAGSAGAYNFPALREEIIKKSAVRIYSFIHISGLGLTGRTFESSNDNFLDDEMTNSTILDDENFSYVKGIKVRADRDATNGTGLLGLIKAKAVAKYNNLPLMVHIGIGPPSIEEIVNVLEQDDIITHAFTGQTNKLIGADGKPLPIVQTLKNKGILLDLGHGSGGFSYLVAEGFLNEGIYPDVISTDMHQVSRIGTMFDLPTTLSKFINMGVSLVDAIALSTVAPAKVLKVDCIGTLQLGCPADIAVFQLDIGTFTFKDSAGLERSGPYKLRNTLTMVAGTPLRRYKELKPHPWVYRDLGVISGPGSRNHVEL